VSENKSAKLFSFKQNQIKKKNPNLISHRNLETVLFFVFCFTLYEYKMVKSNMKNLHY